MTSPAAGATPAPFAPRERRRRAIALLVIAAWIAGLALLVKRDVLIGEAQKLELAAQRLNPGATYFVVEQNGKQIGFASTTIDTAATGIDVVDYFVADLDLAGSRQRASARSVVKLSRGLALRHFDVQVEAPGSAITAGGRSDGDSAIVYLLATNGAGADSQRIATHGPVVLPTLVPLTVALGEAPKVGRTYALPTFDPTTMSQKTTTLRVAAESLFTIVDSAAFDTTKAEWVSALTDTVRAWQVQPGDDGAGFRGWVDAQGRVVQAVQPGGIVLKRMAYEIAFNNWRIARDRESAAAGDVSDIIERSAIAANVNLGRGRMFRLSVKLSGVSLQGYALDGGRQVLRGDTLRVQREFAPAMQPTWSFATPRTKEFRDRFAKELASEPLLQSGDIRMVQRAVGIVGLESNPRNVAERLMRWVYDSLKKEVVFSVPNALEVLRTRRGDCNEHTQLYVALARAIGLPARIATGLAYVRGKFYYHAWPEVWLNEWVAVDPTFGQFPADAAHLRFAVGGLAQQADLVRLVGNLKIDVLEAK